MSEMSVSLLSVIIGAATAALMIISALVGLGWWLAQQFRNQSNELNKNLYLVRDNLAEKMGEVEDKLETQIRAHEKLDDERFNNLSMQLLRHDLQLQAKTGKTAYEI